MSENGIPRVAKEPKGLEKGSSRPVDMDGRGLVLKSRPPYREDVWIGMAAMMSTATRYEGVTR